MAYRTGILFTDGSGSQDVVSLKTQASDVVLADSSNLEDSLTARFKSEGVAAPFKETKTYAVGAYVTHEGFLYRCKKIITEPGAWTGSENWTKVLVTDLEGGESGGGVEGIDDSAPITSTEKVWSIGKINSVLNGNIAPTFSTAVAYSIGDYAMKDGVLYKFTSAHLAGAWNSAHTVAVTCSSEFGDNRSDEDIENIISSYISSHESELKGDDGYSPTVTVTNISGGKRVTITDKNGSHPFDILNGADGSDGVSPTVTITNITNGKRITITDVNGGHPFDIYNGTGGGEVSPEDIASAVEAYLAENPIEGITEDDVNALIADLRELNYDNLGTFTINYKANTYSSSYPYVKLFELTPTDYTNPCIVNFIIESNVHDNPKANWVHDCEMTFAINDQNYISNPEYYFHNRGLSTSYRDFYYISAYQPKVLANKTDYMIPVCIKMDGSAYKFNEADRDFKITITKLLNCTAELTTEHVGKSTSQLVTNTSDYFGWIERTQVSTVGAVHTGDADTQNRTQVAIGLKVSDYPLHRYTLVGEKLDGTIAPFCTNNKTSTGNGLRTPNTTTKFRLGGKLYHYNTSADVINVGQTTASWVLYSDMYYATEARYWISTANGEITIRGNNISGTSSDTLNRPLYLIALDNEDGTYSLDSSLSTTDISYHLATELPSTDDGHIYIEIGGIGTNKTTFTLADNHPVYKWSGTAYTLYGMGDGGYVLTSSDKAEIAELVTADVASVELTQTLTAGQTAIVFNDASITSDSIIDIYVDKWGINPTSVETISGKVTIQFGAQATNMSVKIIVKNPLVDVLSRDVEEVYVGTIQPSASEGYKLWIDPTESSSGSGGGNSPELLWTNSGANNAQFAAQTISLNLSDYKAIDIVFLVHSGYSSHICQRCYLALTDRIFVGAYDEPTSTVVFYDRIVKPTTSGVQFYDGTKNGTTDNGVCVPRYIYGIK